MLKHILVFKYVKGARENYRQVRKKRMNSFGRAFAMKCFLGTLRRKAKKLIPTIEGRLSLLTANCLKSVGYLHQSNAETLAC